MEPGRLPEWLNSPSSSPSPFSCYKTVPLVLKKRALISIFICLLLVALLSTQHREIVDHVQSLPNKLLRNSHEDVYNSTLGFEKIIAIGFPSRTDRRDAVILGASFTKMEVEWEAGVSFEEVPVNAAPFTWDFEAQTTGALGSWRAHMNVLQRIVRENIQTTLIIEDDADWDVHLKSQMSEMAYGLRALQQAPRSTRSPYGPAWDMLWLGHCRVGSTDDEQEFWVVDDDVTVAPTVNRTSFFRNRHSPEITRRNNTRIFFHANAGMCVQAYAVTYDGARKMLAAISLQPRNQPFDVSVSAICRHKFLDPFVCYGAFPPLFSTHRFAGPTSRDSDISIAEEPDLIHEEYTKDLVYSTIMNIPRLVQGLNSVQPQFKGQNIPDQLFLPDARPPPKGYLQTVVMYNETILPASTQASTQAPTQIVSSVSHSPSKL
ncbi:hypothetical protein PV10_00052 [Exophiala mesophila]|uniref:Glycosyl transferase family 25 domain-containing protein n=1 Tax=Exophiala mesophila TaxID=212818 RepID=A0A0D1ZQA8_EXOME|nr:uncharacterized protein PV10_00052 [Exophiala mesophila]KIV96149.1 hypothetical protein PV10_00052 [Exophiala mesophila]